MLPFPNLFEYGNQTWYTGTELIAWDSTVLKSIMGGTGSTKDYTGGTIQNTRFSGTGVPCTLGDKSKAFQYGQGIKFTTGTALYNRELNPATWLTDSWTLDYWTYQSTINTQWLYQMNSIAISATPAMLSAGNNRFIIGSYYDSTTNASNLGVWNNVGPSGSYFVGSAYKNTWVSLKWVHVCIQYDSGTNTFYFYQDGVLVLQFVYAIKAVSISTLYSGCSNPGSPGDICVERYRLRRGLQFSTSGFNLGTLYR